MYLTRSATLCGSFSAGMPINNDRREPDNQALSRLTTRIHALVDALGNAVRFQPTGRQAHDPPWCQRTPTIQAVRQIDRDNAFDVAQRVIERSGRESIASCEYDLDFFKARHLIMDFFARLGQFRACHTPG